MDNQILHTDASDSNASGTQTTAYLDTMQTGTPTASMPAEQTPTEQPVPQQSVIPDPSSQPVAPVQPSIAPQPAPAPVQNRPRTALSKFSPRTKAIAVAILILLLVGGGIAVVLSLLRSQPQPAPSLSVQDFGPQEISLAGISSLGSVSSQTLSVNGQLRINGSLVVTPSVEPPQPTTGQIYYDQTSNHLAYYNGTEFVDLLNSNDAPGVGGGATTNLTLVNTTTGTGGNFARLDATQTFIGSNTFQSNAADGFQVQNSGGANLLAVNTATNSVSLGSTDGASATNINAGTGNLAVTTGAAGGITGSISITTGNSSTTASGNIAIDTGTGIIDGEVIEDKTFEGGLDNMTPWFGSTIAQSTAQARTGTHSLAATTNDPFWGVIELLPGTSVTAGHQYLFSIWVRADTIGRTINANVVWEGSGGQTVPLNSVVDNTTGWTEMTGLGTAPATGTSAYFRISSSGATVGEVHYFDDITITDLSSSSAISAISLGSTNAKIVTIGNLGQIGKTSIRGGSGIDLNSGAAGITLNGGVMNITGSAASALSTTSGALTLTSATAATWGVGSASIGNGENLTVKGGNAAAGGNNDGGDLILQGGQASAAGVGGAVIVRPLTDTTDAFQVQNNAGSPLLTADSTNMTISVTGTDTSFARLAITDAHFSSTQTTTPTISTPTDCGTTPTAAVTAGSTDSAGSFIVTAGSGAVTGPCAVTLTFHQPYGTTPKSVIVVPTTAVGTAPQGKAAVVSATLTTGFSTTITPANPAADEVNSYYYWVIE